MKRRVACCGILLALLATGLPAQEYGVRLGAVQRGGRVTYEPAGPGVIIDALDPALRKWYVPGELYNEYRWQSWQYANYARESYQRYVNTALEGTYYYDAFGDLLTHGMQVYNWQQETSHPFSSQLTDGTGRLFSSLLVASDHQGEYRFTLAAGKDFPITLTPMTFSKPLYRGIALDFASDRYLATMLLSRISEPKAAETAGISSSLTQLGVTNVTNLFGTRAVAQVGDYVKVGATLVNAHHTQTQLQALKGNLLAGQLTEGENASPVSELRVRISDDSPEDGKGGGALFSCDLRLYRQDGSVVRASELGFRPRLEGGIQRPGYLAADGQERIVLRYDFTEDSASEIVRAEISRIEVELVLANDYLVEVTSSNQVDTDKTIAWLPVARARGNVQDGSNQRVLLFDYGLPTANQIAGFTFELSNLGGWAGYAEVDLNSQYRQFPNPFLKQHHVASRQALAWLSNLSYQRRPWFGMLEAFSVAPGYSTSIVACDEAGGLDYGSDLALYEFVDDNDDQDRLPDWKRLGSILGDNEIFPGWDENNDFISDFNQNDNDTTPNLIPDYEEPFLRYYSDSPEYLYGVDMNHNGWVDRFENDEQPDYPYPRDRRGYNLFAGAYLGPYSRLMAGRTDLRQLAEAHRNRATYLVLTADLNQARWGRLRLYQDLSRVKDDIADNVVQWVQQPNTRGQLQLIRDPLAARDTWINTAWMGWTWHPREGLTTDHKLKVQSWSQQADDLLLEQQGLRQTGLFLGLINKADYEFHLGRLTLGPRWKSEYRRQWPVLRSQPRRRELDELLLLVSRLPVLSRSFLELGVEYEIFRQLHQPTPPGAKDSFRGFTGHLQLSNRSTYQGYLVTTVLGCQMTRTNPEAAPSTVTTRSFLTIYAGIEP